MRALCDQDLSALDLRVLACIAYHDRLSLSRETGQGCVASHETLSDEVGCHYTNLSSAISKLKKLGYVQHAKSPDDGRRHVYRVPYDHEDSLSFGKRSAAARDARKTGADAAGAAR
jgi:DNA-binding MarR family transcriptional regulator